jgi:hypothetical protein
MNSIAIVNVFGNANKSLPLWGRWQSEGLTDEVRPGSYSCCSLKSPTSSAPAGHLPQRGRLIVNHYDVYYNSA